MKRLFIWLINFYDRNVSPGIPACCRFYPTCSRYTCLAVEKYGFIRGLALGFIRVLKCAPWHPGGYDPVR